MSFNLLKQTYETPLPNAMEVAKVMMGGVNEDNCFLLIQISDGLGLGIKESLQDMADERSMAKAEQDEAQGQ